MRKLPDEIPLPAGYYEDKNRKCVFCLDFAAQCSGEQGLAYAILLKAVQDGCNAEWLKEISAYYGINIDPDLFDNMPARRMKMFPADSHFSSIECDNNKKKLVLSWRDGVAALK